MFLSVKQLEVRRIRFEESFEPGVIDFAGSELRQVTPLATSGVAHLLPNTGGQIRIEGAYHVDMEADCDRCLSPARFALEQRFDLFYHPLLRGVGEEIEIDEGAAEIAFYEGDGLMLEDVLREQVLLALPMQRVCREDCRGICPVCGSNRNDSPCECHETAGDERWSALKKIRIVED